MEKQAKHVLSHAGIYLIARGLPGLIAFLAIPLFTRILSKADYGRYALALAGVNLLNALLFQWLRLSLVRFLPAFKDNAGKLRSTLATVACASIAALGVIALAVCALPVAREWRPMIGICWLLLAAQAMFDLCNEYSRAALQPWRYMALQVCRSFSAVLLGAVLVLLGMKWRGPLVAVTIGMLLAVVWAWRHDWADVRLTVDREILARICHYGIPLSLTVALAVVIGSSDRFLIAFFRGEESAGIYSAAVDFTSQTLFLLMMVIQLAMFPIAVRAFEQHGKQAAQDQMRTNASLLMAVGAPCVVGIALLAPGISDCFLGKEFRGAAAGIMPLIALGTFFAGLKAYHFDAAFQFAHRTLHQVWIVLAAAAVNIGLNIVAIPRYGINGSAVASLVAYTVSIVITVYVGRRYFRLPFPPQACVKVLSACAAMAVALYPFRGSHGALALATQIGGGAAVYGVTLLAGDFLELRQPALKKLARSWPKGSTVRAAPASRYRDDVLAATLQQEPVG
ncbi:MAG TPA: polysaccharide biosynthesis C-terminal domain-containing protein [Tepidisphaeraceae bacterium]|jgi:O-antigen/teichoic acid export membrane protein|nr:polysaccharide biosynthesis C-terminal domain-containing protein [Tepidisphaeraceae bacterium]